MVAVAAPHQRTPAQRPLPVAADTPAAAVSAVDSTVRTPAAVPPASRALKHCGSRPVGRAGHPPQPAVDSTADRPATADRRRTLTVRACCRCPASTPEARSARLRWSTRQISAAWADSSVRPARTPDMLPDNRSPGTPTQQRPVDGGRVPRAVRQPSRPDSGPPAVSAAITTGRQCPPLPRPVPSGSRGSRFRPARATAARLLTWARRPPAPPTASAHGRLLRRTVSHMLSGRGSEGAHCRQLPARTPSA